MARFCNLFSSSSGNCTYIGTPSCGILIDAGTSAKRIEQALKNIGVEPSSICAMFITHEHSDHIGGLRVFASRYHTDVYASGGTLNALDEKNCLDGDFEPYIMGTGAVEVCGMSVNAFHTSHDSAESLGFYIETPDNRKITVATDTGVVTEDMYKAFFGSDLILLESNHDLHMLETGPYDISLKRRIKSKTGHLSNDDCSKTVKLLVSNGTTRLLLGHLSEENNLPSLAYSTAKAALDEIGAKENKDYILKVAPPVNMEKLLVF